MVGLELLLDLPVVACNVSIDYAARQNLQLQMRAWDGSGTEH
jgi:hypothetical protein